jgi:membrane associated rhomboid family serine protease
MILFGDTSLLLGYNIDEFYLWQLITAHFVHYDIRHLVTNMLALGLLIYLFPSDFKSHLKATVIAIVFIALYLYCSGVKYYAGYSGLLYVIPGLACMSYIQEKSYRLSLLILVVLVLYISFISSDVNISDNLQWSPLKQSHVLGFFAGFISQFLNKFKIEFRAHSKSLTNH